MEQGTRLLEPAFKELVQKLSAEFCLFVLATPGGLWDCSSPTGIGPRATAVKFTMVYNVVLVSGIQ